MIINEFNNYEENIYKVIEILNTQELLINYGSNDGAYTGEKIYVIEKGDIVFDPDTQEVLGTLDAIKDSLEVYTVYERFSLCKKVNRSIIDLSSLADTPGTFITFDDINIDYNNISYRQIPSPTKIKVGDLVKIG
ncbi:hypothetical protein [Peptostreptococcus porci]|uniref:hypothetical protein n=1 Tax=Peptostreptococcus porci TaxID=2652282 RepID=UPI002A7F0359|nr:hypothetical protein [Peptostreptococcus porci]MDY4128669.1 hypothetical protein [Peptostreptococcus porci]